MNLENQPAPPLSPEEDQARKEADANRPIVLTLTLGKVNYILAQLASCPYEKVYQPVQDIQQMVIAQLKEPYIPQEPAQTQQ